MANLVDYGAVPVFKLDDRLIFPPPEMADEGGLLAVGGDLRPERLLLAYSEGIFPWYSKELPILWHSPDPRLVLLSDELRVNRSLRKAMNKQPYEIRFDTEFPRVIETCAEIFRPDQFDTWITDDMKAAYCKLHELGFAHCAEAWDGDELVGGLYGVSLGAAFFGESMFARADNASKIAFVTLVRQLHDWGIHLIDCQVHTDHLERFGATQWPRRRFLNALEEALDQPTRRGTWRHPGQAE